METAAANPPGGLFFGLDDFLTEAGERPVGVSFLRCLTDRIGEKAPFMTLDVTPRGLEALADPLATDWSLCVSPIVWAGGIRRNSDFVRSTFLAIDVDSGSPGFDEAVSALSGVVCGFAYTTKSHQIRKKDHPPCDRYRLILATSRDAVSLDEHWLLAETFRHVFLPGADGCTSRGSSYVRGGPADCTCVTFGGAMVVDVDAVLAMARERGIEVCRDRLDVEALDIDLRGGKARKKILDELDRFWSEAEFTSPNTCDRMFAAYHAAFRVCLNPADALPSLLAWPPLQAWLERHPHQEKSIPGGVLRAFQNVAEELAEKRLGPIEPPFPTNIVSAGDLPSLEPEVEDAIRRHHELTRAPMDDLLTDRLLASLMSPDGPEKSIVFECCGYRKTSAAICRIAATASSENRYIMVQRTLDDCRRTRDLFAEMGVDTGLLAGFRQKDCLLEDPEEDWRRMYGRKSPCRACPHAANCDFDATRTKKDEIMGSPVVLMAHERFVRLWAAGEVPPDPTVIVDESLNRWSSLSLDVRDTGLLKSVREFEPLAEELSEIKDRGTHRIEFSLAEADAAKLRRRLCSDDPDWTDAEGDTIAECVRFFSVTANRFTICCADGWRLMADRTLIELPNRTVFLDGSARYCSADWPGFQAWSVAEHFAADYSCVRLHAVKGSPTKASLRGPAGARLLAEVRAYAESHGEAKWMLAANKPGTEDFATPYRELFGRSEIDFVELRRGLITGSNAASDCSAAVLALGLFTDVDDYALRASCATGKEIPHDEIWRANGKPRYGKGFDSPDIDLEYRRQHADELYQTMMRIRMRRHAGEECDVFCLVPDTWLLIELDRMMPGISVLGDSAAAKTFRRLREAGLRELLDSDARLLRTFGGGKKPRGYADRKAMAAAEIMSRAAEASIKAG